MVSLGCSYVWCIWRLLTSGESEAAALPGHFKQGTFLFCCTLHTFSEKEKKKSCSFFLSGLFNRQKKKMKFKKVNQELRHRK